MKEIKNKTSRPLRVPLPGGKTVFLGPAKTAQVADRATEHAGIQKLVEDGSIEILRVGEKTTGTQGPGVSHTQTQGATKSFRRGQGDR